MKLAIIDDWSDALRTLPCFAKLDGLDVAVFNDHVDDPAARADQLAAFDAVILIRERSRITRRFLEGLPNLKLISQFGKYPHIDIDACSDHGVLVCSGKRSHAPSHAAAEHSWALIMSAMKNIPGQMQNLQNGKWQQGVGKGLFGRRLGLYGYGRIAKRVAEYAETFGMQVEWWGSADGRARAQADGRRIAKDRAGFFAENDIVSLHVRLTPETRGIITAADLAQMKQDALLVCGVIRHAVHCLARTFCYRHLMLADPAQRQLMCLTRNLFSGVMTNWRATGGLSQHPILVLLPKRNWRCSFPKCLIKWSHGIKGRRSIW